MKIGECVKCVSYFYDERNRFIVEACASVGMSRGKSTNEMLVGFLSAYHKNGHKERI